MPRLNAHPSTSTATTQVSAKESSSGSFSAANASIMNAGSITNSPCAKLIVPEACHSKVKPSAASA
jgi:hypothetical protein